jgi:very-short-patch-repair endonuclease
MHKRTTPRTFGQAKELHRNMTSAEVKLWARLRAHQVEGVHFRNQHAIGKYVVDFSPAGDDVSATHTCPPTPLRFGDDVAGGAREKLIIELDGSQHLEQAEYDEERTKYLESQGYRVIRFWNTDVMKDIDAVIRAIIFAIESESRSEKEN